MSPTLPIELDIITWPVEEINEKQFKKMIHKRTGEVAGIFEDNQIQASKNIKGIQKQQKITYDRKIRMMTYKTGDMVLEYRSDLQNHQVLGNDSYILRTNRGEVLNSRPVHGNRLKSYKQRFTKESSQITKRISANLRRNLSYHRQYWCIFGNRKYATDIHETNGQRMNAYRKLGDYLQDAQLGKNFSLWCGVGTTQKSLPTNTPKRTTSLPTSSQSNKPKTRTLQLILQTTTPVHRTKHHITRSKTIQKHEKRKFMAQTLPTTRQKLYSPRKNSYFRCSFEVKTLRQKRAIKTKSPVRPQAYPHEDYFHKKTSSSPFTPFVKNFRNVMSNWIYKLPKSEFERFLQLCKTMSTQLIENLLEIGVESQELPFERGNVCGEVNW
ncbi:hypothetical protein Glove_66g43 [Diversispora epigaea]|uniref:Uncharacterized protein n=1 Tax=Diversispora epigaea TaxID=1348612 RepID=A0A397JE26_9GLOM|nr:hypothetical protein Glove_66g43 [Diversispora epigaea]